MPTLKNALETLQYKIKKYGPEAHCSQIIVSEEARAASIANKPDSEGRQHTRIGIETYSAKSYSAWHAMVEELMPRCGYNPIIFIDLILLLVKEAQQEQNESETFDGISIALQGLYKVCNYEAELRAAKEERRKRRARN